jgi:hypothetical protein
LSYLQNRNQMNYSYHRGCILPTLVQTFFISDIPFLSFMARDSFLKCPRMWINPDPAPEGFGDVSADIAMQYFRSQSMLRPEGKEGRRIGRKDYIRLPV